MAVRFVFHAHVQHLFPRQHALRLLGDRFPPAVGTVQTRLVRELRSSAPQQPNTTLPSTLVNAKRGVLLRVALLLLFLLQLRWREDVFLLLAVLEADFRGEVLAEGGTYGERSVARDHLDNSVFNFKSCRE